MKKKYLVVLISILIVVIGKILMLQSSENQVKMYKLIDTSDALAIRIETAPGSGEYVGSDSNTWPGEGYVFNADLSRCENGSTLLWNSETNSVLMKATTSDKCYVYFDIYNSN